MKKFILFAAILFAGVSVVKAQTAITDQATLNVKLNPLLSITVNNASKTVNLEYATDANYKDGVGADQVNQDHLSVTSTGGFLIKVEAADLTATSGTKSMPASSILIKAEAGTANPLTGAVPVSERSLSNSAVNLIESNFGGTNKTFNVTFTGAKDDLYADNYIVGGVATTYTTTVLYTITAQ